MNQDDFRQILATPRTVSGAKAPSLLPSRSKGSKLNPFKKPPAHIRREGRSDVLEHSHVDLGDGFVDRAKERRLKELRGDVEESGEVKGLDFELLKKVRSGEFVIPQLVEQVEDEDEGEEMDDEAILDELLKMEVELTEEQAMEDAKEAEKAKAAAKVVAEVVDESVEKVEEAPRSRFKPIIDAKQMKQMKREKKRRKMAMEAMDRLSKPMGPPTPAKKTRAELLAQLRQIQAAKKQSAATETASMETLTTSVTKQVQSVTSAPTIPRAETLPTDPISQPAPEIIVPKDAKSTSPLVHVLHEPSPQEPSPPRVQVGENMFSDDSELSDYNPFAGDSDDDEPPAPPKPDDAPAQKTKRNYFRNAKEEPAVTASVPLTMDPVLAASLRKVAALRDATKKEVLREATEKDVTGEEAQTKNPKAMGMSLGGAGGVYEFDDGDMEWEEEDSMPVGPKKKKRKEK